MHHECAGHTDWRIPNQFALYSIVDLGQHTPAINPIFNTSCTAVCTVTDCSCTQSTYYWSSTTSQINPPYAWGVYFYDGTVGYDGKSYDTSVRAIRVSAVFITDTSGETPLEQRGWDFG